MRVFYDAEWATMIADVLEDGGEMVAASFLTATVARAVLLSAANTARTRPPAGSSVR